MIGETYAGKKKKEKSNKFYRAMAFYLFGQGKQDVVAWYLVYFNWIATSQVMTM